MSNFSIALITGYSKSYIDDKRNEIIRIYIDEVDEDFEELTGNEESELDDIDMKDLE
jgi:hypothetical protein